MKKLIVLIILLTGFMIGINLSRNKTGFRTYQDVLSELINDAPMKTYCDSFYGYCIRYPEFFSPEITDEGFVRLGYWNHERFVIECAVLKSPDTNPVKVKMKEMATKLHAEDQQLLRDSFILSGPLYENGNKIEGYRYHTKFVRNQKLWVAYTLYYPESCKSALTRLFGQIDRWEI